MKTIGKIFTHCKLLRHQSYILSKQACLLKSALADLSCLNIGLYRLSLTTVTARETSSNLFKFEGSGHKGLRFDGVREQRTDF